MRCGCIALNLVVCAWFARTMFIAADRPTSRLLSLLVVGDGFSLVILVWHVSANIEVGWLCVMKSLLFLKQHESEK